MAVALDEVAVRSAQLQGHNKLPGVPVALELAAIAGSERNA